MSLTINRTEPLRLRRGVAMWLIGGALGAKLALLFVFAVNTRFVMDEFWQFGQSKYLFNGMFETIWPAKAVGYAVFYLPSHWIGWDATSMLLAGRLQTALLACGMLALLYGIARRLGEDRVRALLVVLIALSFSTLIERIFRTRAEPSALFFAVAALFLVLGTEGRGSARIFAAGLLSGLSFLCTQKAIYFNVALGLALAGDAAIARHYADAVKRGLSLAAGWCVPLIAYCLLFGGGEALAVAQNLFTGPVQVALHGGEAYGGGLSNFVVQTLLRNFGLYLVCFGGMALAVAQFPKLGGDRRIALIFSAAMAILIFTHNQPWPYVFIMVIPFLALWPTYLFPRNGFHQASKVLLAVLFGFIVAAFARNVVYLKLDNHRQLAVVAAAEAALPNPDDTYFDGIGMLPNRFESTRLWLDANAVATTLREGRRSQAYVGLQTSPPRLIIDTYRIDKIAALIGPLMRDRYVDVAPNIKMAGRRLPTGESVTFNVPVSGEYAVYRTNGEVLDGPVQIEDDSRPSPIQLTKGQSVAVRGSKTDELFLLPAGLDLQRIDPKSKDEPLFAGSYD